MKRIISTILWDIRLQWRNGFYYAAMFVVVLWVLLLRTQPQENVSFFVPVLLFGNIVMNAFYFIGGLLLLEKGERTLEAQVVTPLRTGEYLFSKVFTLTMLSVVESFVIIFMAVGFDFSILPVLIGVVLLAVMFALAGFMFVVRYDSINEYLFPSILFQSILSMPVLFYFLKMKEAAWFFLQPFQPPLELIVAGFQPVETWRIVYSLLYGGLWVWILYQMSQRAFYRFVVTQQGVSA